MTDMMVKATQNRETQRANRANEKEAQRSNRAREKENERSNRAKEQETHRSNKVKERQTDTRNKLKSEENVIKTVDVGFKGLGTLAKAFANDPQWYLEGDELYILGTVPDNFGNPLGPSDCIMAKKVDSGILSPVEGPIHYHPGIMGLDITLAYGISNGKYSDPINKASKTLFTRVQAATSYSKSYQANDMSMYLMAFDSIFAMLSAAKRAYGLIGLSSVINRYVSKGYVMASGFDYDDLVSHAADYRKRINSLITLTRDFNLPHLYIYDRHEQLFSSVYLDYESQKSQAYIPRLSDAYRYALVNKDEGTVVGELQLKTILPPGGGTITMKNFLDMVEAFYNSFANNTDFATISGDMGRTFNELWEMDILPEDYLVLPGRNDLVLQQIRNSTVVPLPKPIVYGAITQDTKGSGYITSYINYSSSYNNALKFAPQEAYLGYWHGEAITKPMVLDTSRLIHFAELRTVEETLWYDVKECGADIVKQTYIYVYHGGGTNGDDVLSVDIIPGCLDGLSDPTDFIRKISNLVQFDNHPLVYAHQDTAGFLSFPVWDFDNYRKFTRRDFAYMNEAALRSLLGANK